MPELQHRLCLLELCRSVLSDDSGDKQWRTHGWREKIAAETSSIASRLQRREMGRGRENMPIQHHAILPHSTHTHTHTYCTHTYQPQAVYGNKSPTCAQHEHFISRDYREVWILYLLNSLAWMEANGIIPIHLTSYSTSSFCFCIMIKVYLIGLLIK